ncbi:unnamed protein product [Chrysoparadoxa australica]
MLHAVLPRKCHRKQQPTGSQPHQEAQCREKEPAEGHPTRPDKDLFDVMLGIVTLLTVYKGGHPAVIILDDDHNFDEQSCDLVKAAVKYLGKRLLIILTARPLPLPGVATPDSDVDGSTKPNTNSSLDPVTPVGLDEQPTAIESSSAGTKELGKSAADTADTQSHSGARAAPISGSEGRDPDAADPNTKLPSTPPKRKSESGLGRASFDQYKDEVVQLQIGAAAFMGFGGGPVKAGSRKRVRRDSGFKRYWNPQTTKLVTVISHLQKQQMCQIINVGGLSFEETIELACRELSCDKLHPLVEVTLALRTQGNPFYVKEYCRLMQARELGGPVQTKIKDGCQFPIIRIAEFEEFEGDIPGDDKGENCGEKAGSGAIDPDIKPVWTFSSSKNVFKILQGHVPSHIETKLLEFLGCLSAQQLFLLKVLSCIGTHDMRSDMLQAIYPIPVQGNPLVEDLDVLEACEILTVESLNSRYEDEAGVMLCSFKDCVIHQVVYNKLSHHHRRELHGHIGDWVKAHQQKVATRPVEPVKDGKEAKLELWTLQLVHHLTLGHLEQKAMVQATVFGVRELEEWATRECERHIELSEPPMPPDAITCAMEHAGKELLELFPGLSGILKICSAIRSGQGVATATGKFKMSLKLNKAPPVVRRPQVIKNVASSIASVYSSSSSDGEEDYPQIGPETTALPSVKSSTDPRTEAVIPSPERPWTGAEIFITNRSNNGARPDKARQSRSSQSHFSACKSSSPGKQQLGRRPSTTKSKAVPRTGAKQAGLGPGPLQPPVLASLSSGVSGLASVSRPESLSPSQVSLTRQSQYMTETESCRKAHIRKQKISQLRKVYGAPPVLFQSAAYESSRRRGRSRAGLKAASRRPSSMESSIGSITTTRSMPRSITAPAAASRKQTSRRRARGAASNNRSGRPSTSGDCRRQPQHAACTGGSDHALIRSHVLGVLKDPSC